MKNKLFLLTFVMLVLPMISAAADIAYVVSYNVEYGLTQAINETGYTYDIIEDSDIASTDFSDYKMILVGNERFDSVNEIPVNKMNSLMINTYHLEEWGWIDGGIGSVTSNQQLEAKVINNISRITRNIPINFQVYTQATYDGSSSSINLPMYYL